MSCKTYARASNRLVIIVCALCLLAAGSLGCESKGSSSIPAVTIGGKSGAPVEAPAEGAIVADDGPIELGPGTKEQEKLLIEAKKAFLTDDYEEAEKHFLALSKKEPISGPTVTAALALGQIYIDAKRKDEALALYQLLVERVPHVAEVQLVVARSFVGAGETTHAIRGFKRTLELQPDFVFVHAELGTLLAQAGRGEEASASFLKYEQGIYAMAKALENAQTPDDERLRIVETFALITDDRATQALVAALGDKHPHVRMMAATTLGELNVSAAMGELERMAIEDPELQVRMAAKSSLTSLKEAPADSGATLRPTQVASPDELPEN
ncbi:MAG: HEAT repeat domain-containing protein [Bradymonadaceae bacterium]|nr:HEAT repeat domain-containing protein [Lujinxingiaceae bacterium]